MLAVDAIGAVPERHPAVGALVGQAFEDFTKSLNLTAAKAKFAVALYNEYLRACGKAIFVDKTPRYYQIVSEIVRIFPAAKFIWLKRNPFAVAASLKTTWNFDMPNALKNQPDHPYLFDFVLGYRRLAAFSATHAHATTVTTYESLVTDPIGTLSDLLAFMGAPQETISLMIDRDHPMLDPARMGDKKMRESKGIHVDSLGHWEVQLSRREMQAVADSFGTALLTSLGYGDALDRARRHGIEEPSQGATASIVARVEFAYQGCVADMARMTRLEETASAARRINARAQ